jgi:hypothetical protein
MLNSAAVLWSRCVSQLKLLFWLYFCQVGEGVGGWTDGPGANSKQQSSGNGHCVAWAEYIGDIMVIEYVVVVVV